MNEYETIYIGRPDLAVGRIEKINEKIQKILKEGKADVIDCRDWGTRKLAYRIGPCTNGRYVYFNYTGDGHFITELERTLKYEEGVIRYLTVRLVDVDAVAKKKKRINQLEEGHDGFDERGSPPESGSASEGYKGEDNGQKD
ncbi:MAG: 30S ribosomal protein S6 [Deltaproteobacteria bacterium]|nr:30S ribosomal protein S6 [Deltaproteobacteria bacterium]